MIDKKGIKERLICETELFIVNSRHRTFLFCSVPFPFIPAQAACDYVHGQMLQWFYGILSWTYPVTPCNVFHVCCCFDLSHNSVNYELFILRGVFLTRLLPQ